MNIPRAASGPDGPWTAPPGAALVELLDATTGAVPRLQTTVSLWFDDRALHLLFTGADNEVVATYLNRDDPIWKEDVVEVFLAPEKLTEYFEIEASPRGTIFDALVTSPEGSRETMSVDPSWNCADLCAAVHIEKGSRLSVALRIPFKSLTGHAPATGERWRANLYRIDRSAAAGDEFTAWRPTLRNPPDFHVASAFGELVFV